MKITHRRAMIISVSVFITVAVVALGALWWQRTHTPPETELEKIEKRVANHYLLPAKETPALVTVLDTTKLSSSYLKQFAKNGDKLLLYQKHGRVVIYRPAIDKIVDVGPLTIDVVDAKGN